MSLLVGPSKAQPPWQTKGDSMIRDTRLVTALGIATLLVLGSGSIAHAQYQSPPPAYNAPPPGYGYPPPPPAPQRTGMYRDGLIVGVGLGVGNISANACTTCGGGLALEFHIGGMLTPRLALVFDLWGVGHTYDDGAGGSTLTNSMFTVGAQYWAMDQLWFKAGLGGARITVSDVNGNVYAGDENALGLLVAGGFEVLQYGNFALDLQLRLGHGTYSGGGATNVAFLVGANWY
jgi:hypothetical protein